MKRILLRSSCCVGLALALPADAPPPAWSSWAPGRPRRPRPPARPTPAGPLYQVTGYQGRVRQPEEPLLRPARRLSRGASRSRSPKLADNQIDFFNARFGGAPDARLVGAAARRQAQDAPQPPAAAPVGRFQSRTTSAPARRSCSRSRLRVEKGNIVALTVPTWLPALAADLGSGNWWRSSRPKGDCGSDTRALAARPRTRSCSRSSATAAPTSGARLLYTATYIPDPRPTVREAEELAAPGRQRSFPDPAQRGSIDP